MSELPEVIELGAQEEAVRLWKGAEAALAQAQEHFVPLCEALDLGLRAAEIMAIQRLRPAAERFPGAITTLLDLPLPDVDPNRDALDVPKALQVLDVVDLLSADDLECVSAEIHRGWEDRHVTCRRSRLVAREVTGVTLERRQRDDLLLLVAYRNRIFRLPPPVHLVPQEVLGAFPSLVELYRALAA